MEVITKVLPGYRRSKTLSPLCLWAMIETGQKSAQRHRRTWTIFFIYFLVSSMSSWTCHSWICTGNNRLPMPSMSYTSHQDCEFHQKSSLYQSISPYDSDEESIETDTQYTNSFLSRNHHWIVLVDDEESIRLAIGNFLYDSGYTVTACSDAEALLHVLSSTEKEPDVIVSDIRMPNSSMDGLKLLSLLKGNDPEMSEFSKWKNIPVILLTAKSLTPDRITGYKLGAQAYLSKPFSPDELLSIIDNLIRRRVEQSNTNLDSKSLDTLKDDLKDIKSLLQTSSSQDRKVLDVDYGKEGVYPSTAAQLTPTEIEVLSLLCDGFSNSEIALKRGKSPIGIGKTISKLYLKTQTKTRTELVRWAVQTGLVK